MAGYGEEGQEEPTSHVLADHQVQEGKLWGHKTGRGTGCHIAVKVAAKVRHV